MSSVHPSYQKMIAHCTTPRPRDQERMRRVKAKWTADAVVVNRLADDMGASEGEIVLWTCGPAGSRLVVLCRWCRLDAFPQTAAVVRLTEFGLW